MQETSYSAYSEKRPLCRRCLLEEIDVDGLYASIQKIKKNIPEENRASEKEYRHRLELCRKCDFLNSGICVKCGCYVELRAAKAKMGCPHENHFW